MVSNASWPSSLRNCWWPGELPDVEGLREEFAPRHAELPQITVVMPAAERL